jgi:hypothetical protein
MLSKVSKHKKHKKHVLESEPKLKDYVLIIYPSVKINKDEFNDIVDILDEVAKIKGKFKKKLKYVDMVQLLLTFDVIDGNNTTFEDIQKDISINMGWNKDEAKTIYWFVIEPNLNIGTIRHNIDKYIGNLALDRVISVNENVDNNFKISKINMTSDENLLNSLYPLNDDKKYDDDDNISQMINTMNADRIYSRIATDVERSKRYLEELTKLIG